LIDRPEPPPHCGRRGDVQVPNTIPPERYATVVYTNGIVGRRDRRISAVRRVDLADQGIFSTEVPADDYRRKSDKAGQDAYGVTLHHKPNFKPAVVIHHNSERSSDQLTVIFRSMVL
jgi:hypothetical protein